ncbi:MAG: family 16 glycosylhydrolase [Capsulimonadaceae bacterium]
MKKGSQWIDTFMRWGVFVGILAALSLHATPAHAQYSLAWGDAFPGPAGSAPNPNYWMYLLGDQFGNGELDYGTNSRSNSYIDGNGDLVIVALFNGSAATEEYTSGHLQTEGLVNVGPYGQVQADMQLPGTDGLGESFWALGSNYATVGWPSCGEIDIMESHGSQPNQSNGTIHAPAYADFGITAAYINGSPLTQSYNIYGMYWMPYRIQFYFNSDTYVTDDLTDLASNCQWPFNQSIFLIDSVGVGGQVAGPPDGTTVFPQYMYTHGIEWNSYSSGVPAAPGTLRVHGQLQSQ